MRQAINVRLHFHVIQFNAIPFGVVGITAAFQNLFYGSFDEDDGLRIARHLKRQLALDAMLGAPDWHLRRHATLRTAP